MCVIAYKPTGERFPSKKTLKTCFINNPDGAGFMFADGKEVHIKKGFMKFNDFWKALQDTRKKYGDYLPYVLHFRIGTQGGTRKDCCHPFPLSSQMNDLRRLHATTSIGVAHNGIIPICSDYSAKVTFSDTMAFIVDFLSYYIQDKRDLQDAETIKWIEDLSQSRLAILDGSGECFLTGQGWQENNGCFYSNGSWKPYTYRYTSKYSSYVYADYEDDLCWEF